MMLRHDFIVLLCWNSHLKPYATGKSHLRLRAMTAWTGWVVPRLLPKSADSAHENNDSKSINAMTSRHEIDPSVLCPGRGIQFHPFGPSKRRDGSIGASNVSLYHVDDNHAPHSLIDEESDTTTIELYLYPPQDHDAYKDMKTPMNILLERRSSELVHQTLNRMVLSLNKQISKLTSARETNVKKSKQRQQQLTSNISTDFSTLRVEKDESPKPWNVEKLSNKQAWKEALSSNMIISLNLMNNITVELRVDVCPPTIVSVKVFEDFTGRVFRDIPLVLEVESLFTSSVVIDWYIGKELMCSNSTSYTPTPADVGKNVSVLIQPIQKCNRQGRGYEKAFRFQNPVEDLPVNKILELRQDTLLADSNICISKSLTEIQKEPLRVMTYNILADQNAYARTNQGKQVSFYPYVDTSILDRKRRMPLLLHEILSYQADIICLQEVDEHMWRRCFYPALKQAGYQGYWSGKSAFGMTEGCAMLWSLHRFSSISIDEMRCYNLNNLVLDVAKDPKHTRWKSAANIAKVLQDKPELKDVISNKLGHILQMVSLPFKQDGSKTKAMILPDRILVANTHLFYHPLGAHIRLMQMYAICRQFERFQLEESAASYPMILCGDMNSSLRRAAGYLLLNRQVKSDHTQIREHYNTFQWLETKNEVFNENVSDGEKRIEHTEQDGGHNEDWDDFPSIELPEHFPSFYPGYPKEPEFTHYLDSFAGSLDHIFVSDGLTPIKWASMPTVADVTEHIAMPSEKLPSDHISLVADFALTSSSFNRDSISQIKQ